MPFASDTALASSGRNRKHEHEKVDRISGFADYPSPVRECTSVLTFEKGVLPLAALVYRDAPCPLHPS